MLLSKSKILWYQSKNDLVLCCRTIDKFDRFNSLQKARYSNVPYNTETMRQGIGGRSSFNGVVATVFGSTGFLGKYVVNQLGKIGTQIILPYRGTNYGTRELRLMGDLGQILFVPFNPRSDDDIRKSIKYSNVVINLIGKDEETSNYSFQEVHVDMAARIARISREMGVKKLIHMSALNVSPEITPYILKGGSQFLASKYAGELEVMREFPAAVIFRPSNIYGHNDRFLTYFHRGERRLTIPNYFFVPLYRKGKETFKQPVHAGDVAKGIVYAATNESCKATTIEAVGLHRYRLDHLVWWIMMTLRFPNSKTFIVNTNPIFHQKIKFFRMIKMKYPQVSLEKLERECHSDVVYDLPTLEDLNVQLTNLEDRMAYELRHLRRSQQYWDGVDEFKPVIPPPRAVF